VALSQLGFVSKNRQTRFDNNPTRQRASEAENLRRLLACASGWYGFETKPRSLGNHVTAFQAGATDETNPRAAIGSLPCKNKTGKIAQKHEDWVPRIRKVDHDHNVSTLLSFPSENQ
jgi:hypothetical protein